jgi:hypothetical protein
MDPKKPTESKDDKIVSVIISTPRPEDVRGSRGIAPRILKILRPNDIYM